MVAVFAYVNCCKNGRARAHAHTHTYTHVHTHTHTHTHHHQGDVDGLKKLRLTVHDAPNRKHLVFSGAAILAEIMRVSGVG